MKVEFKDRLLNLNRIALQVGISAAAIEAHWWDAKNLVEDEGIARLTAYLYGERLDHSVIKTYTVYASWWDHFKDTKLPKWLRNKVMIQTITKSIQFDQQFKVLYPNFVPANRMEYVVLRESTSTQFY